VFIVFLLDDGSATTRRAKAPDASGYVRLSLPTDRPLSQAACQRDGPTSRRPRVRAFVGFVVPREVMRRV